MAKTDTKLYVLVVALSNKDNAKLLQQLKSVSKAQLTEPNVTIQKQNKYLDYLIDPIFQGVNRIFVLLRHIKKDTGYFLPEVEIKHYYLMID